MRWLRFARRPCFCCGCLCLPAEDRQRLKRVLKLVRALRRLPQAAPGAPSGSTAPPGPGTGAAAPGSRLARFYWRR